jgi:probable rRNA maturation factor
MITVYNRQRAVVIDGAVLRRDALLVLTKLGYADFDLSIVIVRNKIMQQYNRTFRSVDKPTDVLSFPFHDALKAGERIVAASEEERNLGDIIISAEYVQQAIAGSGISLDERLRELVVHGICHLLGYDHGSDAEYEAMHALETQLLERLRSA